MATVPQRLIPRIDTKETWSTSWQADPTLRVMGQLQLGVGSEAKDELTFYHAYGPLHKRVEQPKLTKEEPLQYKERWARVVDADRGLILWQGLIKADRRIIKRSASVVRGDQDLVAIGPLSLMRRNVISHSYWWDSDNLVHQELNWIPSINVRGVNGRLDGGRGPAVPDFPYAYGVSDPSNPAKWTYAQYIQYLLFFHASVAGGPVWTLNDLSGQLALRQDPLKLRASQSLLSIIRKLIVPRDGLEFVIIPTEQGYEIRVFTLSTTRIDFGSATMLPNTNTKIYSPTIDERVTEAIAEDSNMQLHDRLEVMGERIESCFSLDFSSVTLEKAWSFAAETAYKTGSTKISPDAEDNDAARTDDLFRYVWSALHATDTFDWQSGQAAPILDKFGNLFQATLRRQNDIRRTMTRLPMKEGGDYSGVSPVETDAGEDFIPPFAVILTPTSVASGKDRGYLMADKAGTPDLETNDEHRLGNATISVLENDWGLVVDFTPKHMAAKNHWSGAGDSQYDPETEGIDYEVTVVTIAAKTDQRMRVYDEPNTKSGDASRAVVEVPKTFYRWLAPSTAIGINSNGTLKTSHPSGMEIRNDKLLLQQVMVGAIARYLLPRFSCEITYREISPEPSDLGKVLVMGSSEGDFAGKAALITNIWFDFQEGESGVKAGYAR